MSELNINIEVSAFIKAIQKVSTVVPIKSILPILNNIVINIEGNVMTLTATDLDTTIETKISIQSEGQLNYCVPAKILLSTVQSCKGEIISLSFKDKLTIKTDSGVYYIPISSADDFPKPKKNLRKSTEVILDYFAKGLSNTLFAVSKDELKHGMTGVYCQIKKDSLIFAATNAIVLAEYKITGLEHDSELSFILRPNVCKIITSLEERAIKISIDDDSSQIVLQLSDSVIITRCIDARFPSYESLIPKDYLVKLNLNKDELLGCVKRVIKYSPTSSFLGKFTFNALNSTVSTDNQDEMIEATENFTTSMQEGNRVINIGLNLQIMQTLLSSIKYNELSFFMTNDSRAILIKPSPVTENESYIILQMPIMIYN